MLFTLRNPDVPALDRQNRMIRLRTNRDAGRRPSQLRSACIPWTRAPAGVGQPTALGVPRQKGLEEFTGDVPIRGRVLRLVAGEHRQFVSWTARIRIKRRTPHIWDSQIRDCVTHGRSALRRADQCDAMHYATTSGSGSRISCPAANAMSAAPRPIIACSWKRCCTDFERAFLGVKELDALVPAIVRTEPAPRPVAIKSVTIDEKPALEPRKLWINSRGR